MPYRICKQIEVENGHMLSKHPDNCKYPHGHSRLVELILEADELDQNEMICDFSVLKEAIRNFLDSFDHAMCINTEDPMYETFKDAYGERIIGFTKQDPTTEVVVKLIYDRVKQSLEEYAQRPNTKFPLSGNVRLARVRLWETSTSWAEYEG